MKPASRQQQKEAALVAAYARGDARAARALVDALAPRLHALARRMLGDAAEAEDVTQEAMLRLFTQAPRWRPGEASVSTWCWRVAYRLCVDRLRRGARVKLGDPPERPDPGPAAFDAIHDAERRAAFDAAMATLPERQRAALALRHDHDLSQAEIAAALDCGVEAVESLLARGRRTLAARLAPLRAVEQAEG